MQGRLAICHLLASGMSGVAACTEIGVHPTTLVRWRKSVEFQSHLNGLLHEADLISMQSLFALKSAAVEKLGELLQSDNSHVSLRAAEAILSRTTQ